MDNYIGWKMFDKVTIVAKQMRRWNPDKWEYYFTDEYQGYIVDPRGILKQGNKIPSFLDAWRPVTVSSLQE